MGLSNLDAEDVSQEVAAEFFIKFREDRVSEDNSPEGYWLNIQKWRTFDKIRRNERRQAIFADVNEENDLDSLPFEKEIPTIEVLRGKLRKAVLKLKKSKKFRKRLKLQKDVQIIEKVFFSEKSNKELMKDLKFKNMNTFYVEKCRAIKTIKNLVQKHGL